MLLPLAFRKIFYKDIPEALRKVHAHRVDRHSANTVGTMFYKKPISRL